MSDRDHARAQAETGFWGAAGAGCLIAAVSTKRILIPFRSGDVNEPHTWGTWGGAIDQGENPADAAAREVHEEAGSNMPILSMIPLYVFRSKTFAYFNFLALVENEFSPRLNWETEASRWVEFGKWPTPMHFGLKGLLSDQDSLSKIKAALS